MYKSHNQRAPVELHPKTLKAPFKDVTFGKVYKVGFSTFIAYDCLLSIRMHIGGNLS